MAPVAISLLLISLVLGGCGQSSKAQALDQKNRAKQLVREAKWAEANTLLQMSVAKNQKDSEAQFLLGLTFYNLNNYPPAADHFQAAIGLDPSFMLARLDLGNVYRDMKRWDKAEATYRDLMQRAPDMSQTYINLASMLEQNKHRKDAIAVLVQGKAKAASPELLTLLGDLYQADKQPQQARAAYEQALKLDPNHAQAKDGLARLGK